MVSKLPWLKYTGSHKACFLDAAPPLRHYMTLGLGFPFCTLWMMIMHLRCRSVVRIKDKVTEYKREKKDFPGGLMVKTVLPLHGRGFDPWSGN